MAVTKDAVWVASSSVNHVVRLDAKTNQPGTIVTVAKPCAGLVVGFGSLWIPSCGDHTVVRLTSARRFVGEGGAVAPSQNHNGRLRQGVCEVPQSNFRSLRPTALSENDFELTTHLLSDSEPQPSTRTGPPPRTSLSVSPLMQMA